MNHFPWASFLFLILFFFLGVQLARSRKTIVIKLLILIIGAAALEGHKDTHGLFQYVKLIEVFLWGFFGYYLLFILRSIKHKLGSTKREKKAIREAREEAEEDLRRQKQEAMDDLHRQKRDAEEELRRKEERLYEEHQARQRQTNTPPKPKEKDPYEVLRIQRGATPSAIKKAYIAMIRKYHPDQAENTTTEIRELAEKMTVEINGAYQELKGK